MIIRNLLVFGTLLMPLFTAIPLQAESDQPILPQVQPSNVPETEASVTLSPTGSERSVQNYFLGNESRGVSPVTTGSVATGSASEAPAEKSSKSADDSGSMTVIPEPGMTVLLLSTLFGGSLYAGRILRRKVIATEADNAPQV